MQEKKQGSYSSGGLSREFSEEDLQRVIENMTPAIEVIQEQAIELERIFDSFSKFPYNAEENHRLEKLVSQLLSGTQELSKFNKIAIMFGKVLSGPDIRSDPQKSTTSSLPMVVPYFVPAPYLQGSWPFQQPSPPAYNLSPSHLSPNNSPPKDQELNVPSLLLSASARARELQDEESQGESCEDQFPEKEKRNSHRSPDKSPQRSPEKSPQRNLEPSSPRGAADNTTQPPSEDNTHSSSNGQQEQFQNQPNSYGRGGRRRHPRKGKGTWAAKAVAERGGRGGGGRGRGN